MVDPLAEVVTLLQPSALFSKVVEGAGAWRIRREETGRPFYSAVLEGACRYALDGQPAIELRAGDFLLVPAVFGFTVESLDAPPGQPIQGAPLELSPGVFRLGDPAGPAQVRMRLGHCAFGSPDAALLVSLLPRLVHVRGEPRLATLVHLVGEESRAQRPAREVVLAHLLEVLLIEALRADPGAAAPPGLLRGLADGRLAAALRCLHEHPDRPWSVDQLARAAAMSRSAFFDRFSRAVGMAPMAYLLAWRMALAKAMLRRRAGGIGEIAARVGYRSASAFSVAFTRVTGLPPSRYTKEEPAAAPAGMAFP